MPKKRKSKELLKKSNIKKNLPTLVFALVIGFLLGFLLSGVTTTIAGGGLFGGKATMTHSIDDNMTIEMCAMGSEGIETIENFTINDVEVGCSEMDTFYSISDNNNLLPKIREISQVTTSFDGIKSRLVEDGYSEEDSRMYLGLYPDRRTALLQKSNWVSDEPFFPEALLNSIPMIAGEENASLMGICSDKADFINQDLELNVNSHMMLQEMLYLLQFNWTHDDVQYNMTNVALNFNWLDLSEVDPSDFVGIYMEYASQGISELVNAMMEELFSQVQFDPSSIILRGESKNYVLKHMKSLMLDPSLGISFTIELVYEVNGETQVFSLVELLEDVFDLMT